MKDDLFEVNYNTQVQNGSVEWRIGDSAIFSEINRVSGTSDVTDIYGKKDLETAEMWSQNDRLESNQNYNT